MLYYNILSTYCPAQLTSITMKIDVNFQLVSLAVVVHGVKREKYNRCFFSPSKKSL